MNLIKLDSIQAAPPRSPAVPARDATAAGRSAAGGPLDQVQAGGVLPMRPACGIRDLVVTLADKVRPAPPVGAPWLHGMAGPVKASATRPDEPGDAGDLCGTQAEHAKLETVRARSGESPAESDVISATGAMPLRSSRRSAVMLILLVLCGGAVPAGSVAGDAGGPVGLSRLRPIASPARAGSLEPNLAALPDGRVVMSWLEPGGKTGMALRCATYDGRRWSTPSTIAAGDSFFVNWADFPSVRPLGGRRLAAHWLWRSGAETYAYDVRISQSEDGGRTWSPPITPHRDGTASEHGFVSLVADSGGALAVWLDGRKTAGHEEEEAGPMPDMTLRAASIMTDGRLRNEIELDDRTCDCCPTAAVTTDRGILVAYRDRSPDEVRDIHVIRREDGLWSDPQVVHPDDWHIAACPVNGPALDARRSHVAIAWYTAAADTPRVYVAFSEDAGTRFGPPIRIDDGSPIGRVQVALLADDSALATWLEASDHEALFRARRIPVHGPPGPAITVTRVSAARASGCPRLVRYGEAILFAWTEAGTAPHVRLAVIAGK